MKSFSITALLAATLTIFPNTFAAPDPNFHIYLAFGQSNMEGQGPIGPQDQTVDKRFQMISTVSGCNGHQLGNWYDAVPPLANCDGKLGPVDYFGRTMVKKLPEQIKVGVAVVAIAGCDIQLFEKDKYQSYNAADYMRGRISAYGGNPYGRLVEMGKKAQQSGVIKGILLHQGETNSGDNNWPNRVKGVYQNLLTDLGLNAQDVPLLAGEVVSSAAGGQCGGMNSIIQTLPQVIPTAHVVSSQGLQQQGDGLHFTSEAYRTFGERYAEEMLKLVG
ncbi:carbohydrate esterase family 6 protein, partial [Piromyces sp. E2]